LQTLLQRKEREFEATLEHFQSDIESLQMERGELKEKLVSVTKDRFFRELVSASSPVQSPSHHGSQPTPTIPAGTPISGMPISNVSSEGLIDYTRHLQRQNWRLKSEQLVENLRKLPRIQVYSLS
jgi:dynactin 1